jgi:hypothetical protein
MKNEILKNEKKKERERTNLTKISLRKTRVFLNKQSKSARFYYKTCLTG